MHTLQSCRLLVAAMTLSGAIQAQWAQSVTISSPGEIPSLLGTTGSVEDGLTVIGTGAVTLAPTRVAVAFRIQATEDDAAEAMGKFRAARTRLLNAVRGIETRATTLDQAGPEVSNPANNEEIAVIFGPGGPVAAEKKGVQVAETVRVNATPSDGTTLLELAATLIDVGRKAGAELDSQRISRYAMASMSLSGAGPIRFLVEDSTASRSQAVAAAIADAKAKARLTARLAGVVLGPMVHVDASAAASLVPVDGLAQPHPKKRELLVRVRFSILQ